MRLQRLLSIKMGGFNPRLFLFLLIFSFLTLYSQNFVKIDSLDDAVGADGANIEGADTDKDGLQELIFYSSRVHWNYKAIAIYERQNGGGFVFIDTVPIYNIEWGQKPTFAVGDFDNDGKSDILVSQVSNTAMEYFEMVEAPIKFGSYPDTIVWMDSLYLPNVDGPNIYVSDIDKDNKINITINKATLGELFSFENTGDNQYQLAFRYDSQFVLYWGASGDLDMDSLPEVIFADYTPWGNVLKVYEAVGDDTLNLYEPDTLYPLAAALYDNLFIGDMNGNGKPEAMIHGFSPRPNSGTWTDMIWIIEAEGDNDYTVVWFDSIPNNTSYSHYGARSSVGDVTGDGVPEIVLSMTMRVYIIQYIPGQGYTYIWQKYFPASTANISTTVYDIDNDTLNEVILSIVFSGPNPKTYIYKNTTAIKEKQTSFILPEFTLKNSITTDSVKILISRPLKSLNLYLFNTVGQKIVSKNIKNRSSVTLNLNKLNIPKGTYFIKIEHENNSKIFKIIYMKKE